MKTRSRIRRFASPLLLLLAGLFPWPAPGAEAPKTSATSTNDPHAIPQSVFLLPGESPDVKDPFFPDSTRLGPVITAKTNRPVTGAELTLQGLSGNATKPLATINGRILEPGQEADLNTPTGRVRVRCIEINLLDQYVVVEAAGVRRELRFPRRK